MNWVRRKFLSTSAIASAVAWVAWPLPSSADPGASEQDFAIDNFLAITASVRERAQFHNRPERTALDQILSQGVKLQSLLNGSSSSIPVEFRKSIVDLTELIGSIEFNDVSAVDNMRNLALVQQDVQIKWSYLFHGAGGFAFRKNLQVLVEITTLKDGRPFEGYEVAFNPLRLALNRQPRYPVASTTNNAKRLLPPGLYIMTLRRIGAEINRTVEIGEDGSEEQTIRIDL